MQKNWRSDVRDSAALLVDEILPHQPMRQWVLSFPFPLRFLFASNPKAMAGALGIVYRAISTHMGAGACWNAIPATAISPLKLWMPQTTINDQIQDVNAKESTKPAISRLDWRNYEQKSIS